MRPPIPTTAIIGFVASAAAIGLWIFEQLSGLIGLEILTIPVKLVLLVAPLFFLSDLSTYLHRRPLVAVGLAITLAALTLCAMMAYLPFRTSFAAHFNNGEYRWYFVGMRMEEGDFEDWKAAWLRYLPHLIEVGLVSVYYSTLITACAIWRLRRVGGAVVAFVGYLLLLIVPILTGLILWDYDVFLKGIAFDSISMDLFPVYFWYAGDYSIFLYSFMLIFFGTTAVFFHTKPRRDG